MKHIQLFILILIIFISCESFNQQSIFAPVSSEKEVSNTNNFSTTSVEAAIFQTDFLLNSLDQYGLDIQRDIDNRDWIISYINYSANRDMILVQSLYENIKYRSWDLYSKKEYLNHYYRIDKNGNNTGTLFDYRRSVWEEISYLLDHSTLLLDTPWLVRDFFDENSEFNYWYLIYLARLDYSFWIEETILPSMLSLIPEDRINGVSYLWIKNPETLSSMKQEIARIGYPWNKLFVLMEMNRFLQEQLDLIYDTRQLQQETPCLF